MKKINRLKLKARDNNWDVVGHAGLQFCGNIMPRFGLETGSDYIMSIRTTPKKKTHRKITMSLSWLFLAKVARMSGFSIVIWK
jgi:hypothetical protein